MGGLGTEALREMRRARRRRAYARIDWIDAVYRVYVTALLSAIGTSIVTGAVGGRLVTPGELAWTLRHGPAVAGLVVAVAVASGLRAGGRGGPLVPVVPDVTLVLLAPIPRAVVLRGIAFRQLRFSGFVGTVIGMVAGNVAAQRLPGPYAAWVASCGLAGAVAGLAFTGSALLASGLRLGRRGAALLAAVAAGWSVVDLAAADATSPATFLGRLAMLPLSGLPAPAVGATLLALPLAGLVAVGGTSLEAARRQAGLVAQLRFALTMQDVRTVVLLRRQLAAEGPRRRPWLRLKSRDGVGQAAVWRRDCQGVLRWPGVRILRMLMLGASAGATAAVAWEGTPAVIVLTGLALLVAALDAVEGLSQEADHPGRSGTLPVASGWLTVRHLAVPVAVMLAVTCFAVASTAVLGPPPAILVAGAIVAGPAALAAVVAAALSVRIGPAVNPLQPGPIADGLAAARTAAPPVLAIIGVLPLADARAAFEAHQSVLVATAPPALLVLVVTIPVILWLRRGA